ncbi:uncharacterized protein LOC125648228 [Ostrea edulis]|uniref:uncharacterized protein LOC125648228 n=1 Tax=Ostrea edulis TaxID=37623 RepID=UPI0020946236|nr:uncharacterized protein LOC125648228 [Ostrea edulis]
MLRTQILAGVCCLLVTIACLVESRFIEQNNEPRSKRQTADMRLSELQAINEILNRITPGCSSYACGVVDVYSRFDKRAWSDQRMAELKALLGLKNQGNVIAHGLFDPYKIFIRKRTSSDQRIAELQALIALVHGRGNVAHGQLDPSIIGRRKRAANLLNKAFSKRQAFAKDSTSH